MSRSAYSAAVRQQAIQLILHKRLSIRQAADKIGCNANTIHRWLNEHKKQSSQSVTKTHAFVPIQIKHTSAASAEVAFSCGITLRINELSVTQIIEIINALRSC